MAHSLVLLSDHPLDQEFASTIAQHKSLTLKLNPSESDLFKLITELPQSVILFDCDHEIHYKKLYRVIYDQVGIFSDRVNSNWIHAISQNEHKELVNLHQSPFIGHFIKRSFNQSLEAQEMGKQYSPFISASLLDQAFGVKNFFSSDKIQLQSIKISNSNQKQNLAEGLKNYMIKAKIQSRQASVISNAIDEILMNAIFDAPTDELGHHIHESTPRDTPLPLEGKNEIQVTLAYDGIRIALSVSDQYGSIDREKLLRHLTRNFTESEYKIKTSVAGAGLGLSTTSKMGGTLIFICEKQTKTEVIVCFRRYDNYKEFREQFHSINTYFYF